MKFGNFLETNCDEKSFDSNSSESSNAALLKKGVWLFWYFTFVYTLCHIPVVRVHKSTCSFIITNLICTST